MHKQMCFEYVCVYIHIYYTYATTIPLVISAMEWVDLGFAFLGHFGHFMRVPMVSNWDRKTWFPYDLRLRKEVVILLTCPVF